jgi:hypothetical protein
LPEDLLIEAVTAILPKDILNQITAKKSAKVKSNGDGFGLAQKSALRGRPLPALIGRQTTKQGSIFYQVYVPLRPGKNCATRSRRVTRALSFSQVTCTFKGFKIGPNVSLYSLSTHLALLQ